MLTDSVYVNRQFVVQFLRSLRFEDEFRLSIYPCSDGSEGMGKELHGEDYVNYFTDFGCCFQDAFWVFKELVV